MEEIPLLRRNTLDTLVRQVRREVHAKQARKVAALAHLPEYLIGNFLSLLPLGHIGLYLLVDPLSDFVTERSVGLVEVGRVILRIDVRLFRKIPLIRSYRLVPRRIGIWDQVAIRVQSLGLLGFYGWLGSYDTGVCLWLDQLLFLLGRSGWRCGRCSLGVQRANLKLLLVLLENALVVVLPELLRGILASDTLQNFATSVVKYIYMARNKDLLFLPPGWSSWNLVKSYTSSSTMMYRLSALL